MLAFFKHVQHFCSNKQTGGIEQVPSCKEWWSQQLGHVWSSSHPTSRKKLAFSLNFPLSNPQINTDAFYLMPTSQQDFWSQDICDVLQREPSLCTKVASYFEKVKGARGGKSSCRKDCPSPPFIPSP